ncbi:MAG: hypothetical protein KAT62_00805 [Desulfuromonadales bacterium]|nr:hypothetical protein [Desulfuromonadales bacterium]
MGKATIIGGGPGGRYHIRIEYDRTRPVERTDNLQTAKQVAETVIADLEVSIPEMLYQIEVLNAEITALRVAGEETTAKESEREKLLATWQAAKTEINRQRINLKGIELEKSRLLEIAQEPKTMWAWCVDRTESLSGEVATIEVGRVGEGGLFIRPGWNNQATYDANRDGLLYDTRVSKPSEVYYALALLPGAEKFRPRYRTGQITVLDQVGDTCSLQLDNLTAAGTSIDVNTVGTLENVPIRYMQCNAMSFAVGDRVVIEFSNRDWANPVVIGFTEFPKKCSLPPYIFIPLTGYEVIPVISGGWLYEDYFNGINTVVDHDQEGDLNWNMTPGYVWDIENHCRVPIINPYTGVEITFTERGNEELGIVRWDGVYVGVAETCLGVQFGGTYRNYGPGVDSVDLGEGAYGVGEGLLRLDNHIYSRVDRVPTNVDGWYVNEYADPVGTYNDDGESKRVVYIYDPPERKISWFDRRGEGESTYDSATKTTDVLQSVITPYAVEYATHHAFPGWQEAGYYYDHSGEAITDEKTDYSIDGKVLLTKNSRTHVRWENPTGGLVSVSGGITGLGSFVFGDGEQPESFWCPDDMQLSIGPAVYEMRHRNRILIIKNISVIEYYNSTDPRNREESYTQIEYSNQCPLKSLESNPKLNADYDHSAGRQVMTDATLRSLNGGNPQVPKGLLALFWT